jgi:hypothetical protein
MPELTETMFLAILERDSLIERIRSGEEDLIPTMIDACNRVEELAQSGLVFMEPELAH